jgi:hypothetical protein
MGARVVDHVGPADGVGALGAGAAEGDAVGFAGDGGVAVVGVAGEVVEVVVEAGPGGVADVAVAQFDGAEAVAAEGDDLRGDRGGVLIAQCVDRVDAVPVAQLGGLGGAGRQ